jgi:CMP-N,N'-diacetyllegionaminic acid synthase
VLGLIPARGRSKGVARKNARLLGGRPLVAYSADSALAATGLARVVLSTDDEEIAEIGRACGLDVPFLRPAEFAADETPMVPVVQHALGWLERLGERFDAVCLLQPTVPFREPDEIDGCIDRLASSDADAVLTMAPVPPTFNPHWVFVADGSGFLRLSTGEPYPIGRRQDLPPAWHRDGSVYVTRRDVVTQQGSLLGRKVVGYEVQRRRHVNIDTAEDWALAESIAAELVTGTARV